MRIVRKGRFARIRLTEVESKGLSSPWTVSRRIAEARLMVFACRWLVEHAEQEAISAFDRSGLVETITYRDCQRSAPLPR